ncbi:uncharacterized protein LOC106011967 [Aplysia californica]|uniref:Uncharacterized protein LOC106011967 n=1 Tax=Aplysia californica TaxID=6500 RepID=A0ABM1A1C9_APLCA|nr:uncharacterized protein LOC106011967 [Aplysia californica]
MTSAMHPPSQLSSPASTENQTTESSETSPSDSSEKNMVEWTRPTALEKMSFNSLARVSEVMLLDSQGGVLAHKRSLQNIPYRKAQKLFAKHLRRRGQKNLNPYFRDENVDFFYLSKNDVYLVAAHPTPEGADSAASLLLYLDLLQRYAGYSGSNTP